MYAVITENDISQWEDDTGLLYHFPKRYRKYLETGTKVIYYKGTIKDKSYSNKRLSDQPHYFGMAVIGQIYADKHSDKGDLFAVINEYQAFNKPVIAKNNTEYLEYIPENKKSNYWRDGVRSIDESTYKKITSKANSHYVSEPISSYVIEEVNDLENTLESFSEGEKKLRYVTLYERDKRLRKLAIAIHGKSCIVCGFDFGQFYGEYAEGYIHIHHIVPVSEFGQSRTVNPETDLVPVCANCHSIIHRFKKNTLSVEQLKSMIKNTSNNHR